ncbi:hypothetical protein PIROE2DRAFT_9114 [Piromyces sp. E2]|nr:hypothetical protein PIROE2DRAFT_9114 [Piromyces sp. E2]|eukprot:OUM64152.1 hypothetical protein PIROE2DRAFT_9114 [Piromyces sp. E2]
MSNNNKSNIHQMKNTAIANVLHLMKLEMIDSRDDISEISGNNSINNSAIKENNLENNSENISSENGSSNTRSLSSSSKVFNYLIFFLVEDATIIKNKIERENLCKYQLKSGSLSDIPFLAKTAAFFNIIMPIVSGQRWSASCLTGLSSFTLIECSGSKFNYIRVNLTIEYFGPLPISRLLTNFPSKRK